MKWKLLAWVLILILVPSAAWFGRVVPFAEQWPMFEALRTTAAIIFAVIGAWMAIIYPERLKLSLREPTQVDKGGATGLGKLFTPVVNSTAILCIILVLGATVPVLRRHALPCDVSMLRGGSYALLVTLTLWQLWTVVLSLVPASIVKSHADREDDSKRARDEAFKLASHGKSPKNGADTF
jgi:hypothetical protein